MKTKKILFLSMIILFILIALPKCIGSFDVQPRELFLTMDTGFIKGNTSEKITVINAEDTEVNISWYLDNPSSDLIRSNRTVIPNLNWVDLEPKWQIVSGNGSADFFVLLNIPDDEDYLNKNWEIWITFKEEESGFIKFEHAVRFYIDTPRGSENNILSFSILIFIFVAVVSLSLVIYFLRKKRRNLS